MNDRPLVSVLMPVYNAEPYIQLAVDSILAQTYENLEILISDDGSTDNTQALLDKYQDPRIRFLHQEENCGKVRTFNRLIEHSRGELIAQQDADDYSSPKRIETQVDCLLSDSSLGLVSCDGQVIDKDGLATREILGPRASFQYRQELIQKGSLPFLMPSVVFKRETIEKVGGYSSAFSQLHCYGEDSHWVARMLDQGYQIKNIAQKLYFYRETPGSLCNPKINLTLQDAPKLYAQELLLEIYRLKYEEGVDALLSENEHLLTDIVDTHQSKFNQDPRMFFERMLRQYFKGNCKAAFFHSLDQLFREPKAQKGLAFSAAVYFFCKWLAKKLHFIS